MDSLNSEEIYGFDLSQVYLEFNKKKNITTILGNLFEMPFDTELLLFN